MQIADVSALTLCLLHRKCHTREWGAAIITSTLGECHLRAHRWMLAELLKCYTYRRGTSNSREAEKAEMISGRAEFAFSLFFFDNLLNVFNETEGNCCNNENCMRIKIHVKLLHENHFWVYCDGKKKE